MSAAVAIGFSEDSRRAFERWREAPQRFVDALDAGMTQVLFEAETAVKVGGFSGGASPGGGQVGIRSGELRQDVTHEQIDAFAGTVGTTARTAEYARAVLSPDATTIRPVNAKHLWVPIADNLNPSGVARYSPRALFDAFGKRVRVFTSKAGNKVAIVGPETSSDDDASGGSSTQQRGRLMFVLKDQVIIQGTDALAREIAAKTDRYRDILTQAMQGALS